MYKIRRKSDGKFSTGGLTPRFTKKGKVWTEVQYLKSHLNMLKKWREVYRSRYEDEPFPYIDCEIVGFASDPVTEPFMKITEDFKIKGEHLKLAKSVKIG
jgi:hypothetical protein